MRQFHILFTDASGAQWRGMSFREINEARAQAHLVELRKPLVLSRKREAEPAFDMQLSGFGECTSKGYANGQ